MGNLAPRSDARQGSALQPSSNEGLELNPLWDIREANPTSHGRFQDGRDHTNVHKKTQNEPCGLSLEPLFHSLTLFSTKLVHNKQIGKPILGSSSNNVSISFTRANRAAIAASRHILAPTRYEARAMNLFFGGCFETQSPSKFLFMLNGSPLELGKQAASHRFPTWPNLGYSSKKITNSWYTAVTRDC